MRNSAFALIRNIDEEEYWKYVEGKDLKIADMIIHICRFCTCQRWRSALRKTTTSISARQPTLSILWQGAISTFTFYDIHIETAYFVVFLSFPLSLSLSNSEWLKTTYCYYSVDFISEQWIHIVNSNYNHFRFLVILNSSVNFMIYCLVITTFLYEPS